MAYRDVILADNPSNYWRLNEPSGTTAVDLVGAKNGTISGGVTLNQPGALADGDKAMTFDGTTGQIVTAATAVVTPCTIEAWFKTTITAVEIAILSTPYSGTQEEWSVRLAFGALAVNVLTAGQTQTSTVVTTGTSYSDGGWHHLAAIIQSGAISIFIDGAVRKTGVPVFAVGGMTLAIEIGYRSDGDLFFNGSLDDVAIYPVALTAAQIAAHYTAGISGARPISWGLYANGFAA